MGGSIFDTIPFLKSKKEEEIEYPEPEPVPAPEATEQTDQGIASAVERPKGLSRRKTIIAGQLVPTNLSKKRILA